MRYRYPIELLVDCLRGGVPRPADLVRITNLANHCLVTPQLFVAQSGYRRSSPLERDIIEYWQSIHRLNEARNERLEQQLSELLEILNSLGVAPLLLTGAGALATSARTTGRMVADLDIMLHPDEVRDAIRALVRGGYTLCEEARRHTAAKLIKLGDIGLVHVHRHAPGAGSAMPVGSMARDAQTVAFRSHRARLPSATDRLCYLIGHDMLEARGLLYGELNLRHSLDAVETLESGQVDWTVVRERFRSGMRRLAYEHYMMSLSRLFGIARAPKPPFEAICNVLYRRQMLKSETGLYAALDQALVVLPIRASFRLTRGAQSAIQTYADPVRTE